MTPTPEDAYKELTELYRSTNLCAPPSREALLRWAVHAEEWATVMIFHYGWTYRRAEKVVNRCRVLQPLAQQHQLPG
jgi:hypothetical protein